jgi:uncharacterized protein YndB with AHSA1/START domain
MVVHHHFEYGGGDRRSIMSTQESNGEEGPDVRKAVIVPAARDEAFRILTGYPAEWLPPGHTFISDPAAVIMEPRAGGRFYERAADGTEVTRGTITEWAPPGRLVVTWRVGPGWRPVFDDERASLIEVDFTAAGAGATEVVFTYTELHRHGEMAGVIRGALAGQEPGETLERYAAVVARHARPDDGA